MAGTGTERAMTRDEGWFALSLLLLAVVTTVDLTTPRNNLAVACAAAPFLAAATCRAGRALLVAMASLATGLTLVLTNREDTLSDITRVVVLLLAAVLGPLVARTRERRERQVRDLARVARVAQEAILTPVPPSAGVLRLATAYESASREAQLGGDLFAAVRTDDATRLLVGDVRGKGLDAVKTAALALALFREAAHRFDSPEGIARHCDEQLRPQLGDEDFVTAIFASIGDDGCVEYVSHGHPPPLLAQADSVAPVEVENPGLPLGLGIEGLGPETEQIALEAGDRLLFFTDGLVEARDRQGRFIDVMELAGDLGTADFDQVLPSLLLRLHSAAPQMDDDLALLLVEYDARDEPAATPETEASAPA